jgi:hypothetical protein
VPGLSAELSYVKFSNEESETPAGKVKCDASGCVNGTVTAGDGHTFQCGQCNGTGYITPDDQGQVQTVAFQPAPLARPKTAPPNPATKPDPGYGSQMKLNFSHNMPAHSSSGGSHSMRAKTRSGRPGFFGRLFGRGRSSKSYSSSRVRTSSRSSG